MVKKWNIGHLVLNIDPNTGLFVVGVKGSNEGLELTREEGVELRKFLDGLPTSFFYTITSKDDMKKCSCCDKTFTKEERDDGGEHCFDCQKGKCEKCKA